jgi:hypothetical protein
LLNWPVLAISPVIASAAKQSIPQPGDRWMLRRFRSSQ